MSSPTDQQLIQFIGQGRRDALAQLFERYSADLYDYLARLVGDRDQAARLLQTVMLRVPGAAPGFQPRDSVRGWLYSLAREAGLDWLRQRGWLDGLPPSDEPIAPGLVGDVWKAARAMPAFFRAVLITEELQPLSPTEKARALGVNRTDLPRLVEEARHSFNRIYDAQARAEGRPTSDRIDPESVWNARRRLPLEGGSLFGFLPPIALPESLGQQIRRHVVEAMTPPPERPTPSETAAAAAAGAAAATALLAGGTTPTTEPPPPTPPPVEPAPPRRHVPPAPYQVQPVSQGPLGGLPTTAIAALIGVALALLICGGIFLLTQNRSRPTITSTQPQNGQTIQQAPEINVFAVYSSDREIDRDRSTMQIDGRPVTPLFVNNSIAWTGALDVGSHAVEVVIRDTAGGATEQTWTFFIVAAGTPVPSPSGAASVTPIVPATVTPIVPLTSQAATVTPILLTATPPTFPTMTPPPPTFVPPFPTWTPCTRGAIVGVTFNDLNGNGVQDPNEPGLAGVVMNLTTLTNSVLAVAVSDTFGNYRFGGVPLGQYRVVANTPPGWIPTTTTSIAANLFGCGTVSGFNFGFIQSVVPPSVTFTPTPTATFSPVFNVTNVTAFVSPLSSNTCPTNFTFNGTITTNGAGSVTYQWVRSDGVLLPPVVLPFASAGTQNVAPLIWTANANMTAWAQLQVLSPNNIASAPATFTLSCGASPSPTFTPTSTGTPTLTPTPSQTVPSFLVTNVTSSVSPTSSTTCPQVFTFNGDITVMGTGNVTYQWERSDGSFSPVKVLTFLVPGTQSAAPEPWTISGPPPFNFSGWGQLHVLTPNIKSSPQANFTLTCLPPTNTPTDTPTPTNTPTETLTPTPTNTPTETLTPTPTNTP